MGTRHPENGPQLVPFTVGTIVGLCCKPAMNRLDLHGLLDQYEEPTKNLGHAGMICILLQEPWLYGSLWSQTTGPAQRPGGGGRDVGTGTAVVDVVRCFLYLVEYKPQLILSTVGSRAISGVEVGLLTVRP